MLKLLILELEMWKQSVVLLESVKIMRSAYALSLLNLQNDQSLYIHDESKAAVPEDTLYAASSDSDAAPSNNIVQGSWVQLVNASSLTAGSHSYPLTGDPDLGNYDIMALRFRARSAGVGATYDNFAFVQIPEPSTCVLAALGLLGLLGCGRRRRG